MRKLSLNVDELRVESFASTRLSTRRGTVDAYFDTGTEATCGACQGTINDVECHRYSVYVACPNEVGP